MTAPLTPRQRFINTLERRPPSGRVPHFELVFFLTMEAFGKLHPSHRHFDQWAQMTDAERRLHRRDIAQVHVDTARKYEHSAIFIHGIPPGDDEDLRFIDVFRDMIGDEFFLMIHGDPTYEIPAGKDMTDFCAWLDENPRQAQDKAEQRVRSSLDNAQRLAKHGGLDGFALCSDYCFNTGPFFSLDWFDKFVTPYLVDVIAGYRDLGFYTIKHTRRQHHAHPRPPRRRQTPRPPFPRSPGRRRHRRNQTTRRRQGLPLRKRQLRPARHRHRPAMRRLRPIRTPARYARRRIYLLHLQLHLHRYATPALRTHPRRLASPRQLPPKTTADRTAPAPRAQQKPPLDRARKQGPLEQRLIPSRRRSPDYRWR